MFYYHSDTSIENMVIFVRFSTNLITVINSTQTHKMYDNEKGDVLLKTFNLKVAFK